MRMQISLLLSASGFDCGFEPALLNLRWLEVVSILLSLAFYCSHTNNVEVKLLVQLCKVFTNEQIAVAMTSKFVTMATQYEVKGTLFFTV